MLSRIASRRLGWSALAKNRLEGRLGRWHFIGQGVELRFVYR
jgi:hypothetical protein